MILADKILTNRKKNGWSQEELAEKLNVSRQSISKWESAASIPDIGKIIELAALFGVTTDYLLKDDQEEPQYTDKDETDKRLRVSIAEANDFILRNTIFGRQIALGVMLCLLSPVMIILLTGFSFSYPLVISENTAAAIGIVTLFAFISTAVAIFILSGMKMKRFNYLKNSDFELEYGVYGIINERRNAQEKRITYSITAGVVLCIMSVTPLIIAGIAGAPDVVCIFLTSLMFFMLAFAIYLFVTSGTLKSGFDQLLKDGEFKPTEIKKNKVVDRIAGAYWPIVTAIYLGWSFFTFRWDFTWVIWPVAALLFAGIAAVFEGRENK